MAKNEVWLGLDPGSSNFAVTVFRYNPATQKSKILYVSMIENPIKNLTDTPVWDKPRKGKTTLKRDEPSLDVGVLLFTDEIEWLFDTFGVTHVVGERFQVRGKFGGDLVEVVNVMLGIIINIAAKRRVKFMTTTAGVWKNAMARLGGDLQGLYERGKLLFKLEPHVIDSTLIAMWHANKVIPWANRPYLLQVISARLQPSAG